MIQMSYCIQKFSLLSSDGISAVWILNITIVGVVAVIRRIGGNIYTRELITNEDGGTVGLDWFKESNEQKGWKPATPIVLVMHGITGE